MKAVYYEHPEAPARVGLFVLEEGETIGWANDKYTSSGKGIVVIELTPAAWNWHEYNHPDNAKAGDPVIDRLVYLNDNWNLLEDEPEWAQHVNPG